MSYKVTCTLLNSWLRATDPDAGEEAFASFLDLLERKPQKDSKAMQEGRRFEDLVSHRACGLTVVCESEAEARAVTQFGQRLTDAQMQVRAEKPMSVAGMDFLLVGVADALHAGILSDIKRVQRYEYGKYQFSTQHPMYMELFPEALRFDYLVFDGSYCYREQYRRGSFQPIEQTIKAFVDYLQAADLMDVYKKHWRIDE